MPRIGSHMSIAGGLPLAVDRAAAHGCETLQIFSKSSNQWRARALPAAEITEFRRKVAASGMTPVVAHASYLINLASASLPLRARSTAAFGEEIDRAEALGLMGVVLHPGSYTDGTEDSGLAAIAAALAAVLRARPRGRTMVLLEQTAGQGTTLGHRFEQIADLLKRLRHHRRVGVCLDTCHLFAAGYDIRSDAGYRTTLEAFDRIVGLDRLKLMHLNDSKKPCGSRVDRHEHIGHGTLGTEPFRRLLTDARLAHVPMVLETPKSEDRPRGPHDPDPLDVMNLQTLRDLRGGR
ncbi:MAG: deoxyribonuclease IV [Acidobacteria bacterium]|nr:deoxyribonuclease IV [Planctomycetota bacterium]MBE3134084.1 deoxyribonuclease IV [Acidobacteriota bacterium]